MSLSSPLPSSPWALLPQKPGIYIYKNAAAKVIYVGKAKSLRDRVHQYFQPPQRLGPKTAALVSQIASIEHVEVGSEIEALLLESTLIKKYKPQYNIASKDDKSPYFIHLTQEDFPRPILNHQSSGAIAGPFLNSQIPRSILKQFRRIAPFCSANRPVKRACFYSHIGLCSPCPGQISPEQLPQAKIAYRQNIQRLRRLLSGQFTSVTSQLTHQMQDYSDKLEFEKAGEIKSHLSSLEYLLHQPVRPDEYLINPNLVQDKRQESIESLRIAIAQYSPLDIKQLSRIELYDNAHLGGVSATSAMTVAIDGEINSKYYRHFTIKSTKEPDDVAMMREVLARRLKHEDWPKPDLLILDGGPTQLSVLQDPMISSLVGSIPVIGIAKKEEILIIPTGEGYFHLQLPKDHPGLQLVQRLRDEAHRFSRRLHHKHRSDSLIPGH